MHWTQVMSRPTERAYASKLSGNINGRCPLGAVSLVTESTYCPPTSLAACLTAGHNGRDASLTGILYLFCMNSSLCNIIFCLFEITKELNIEIGTRSDELVDHFVQVCAWN
jgi:hypothetical protein